MCFAYYDLSWLPAVSFLSHVLASFLLSFSCTPAGPPGVSLNSFLTQRPDLLSWVYVRPLAFGLSSNLSPHLALYRVRVPTFISLLHASFSHILSDAPLRFATLGDEYLRPVFHRQELRHARHTRKRSCSGSSQWHQPVNGIEISCGIQCLLNRFFVV